MANSYLLKHMAKNNSTIKAPPFEVEAAIRRLGANLRTARLARNLSIGDVAAKLGMSLRPGALLAGQAVTPACRPSSRGGFDVVAPVRQRVRIENDGRRGAY